MYADSTRCAIYRRIKNKEKNISKSVNRIIVTSIGLLIFSYHLIDIFDLYSKGKQNKKKSMGGGTQSKLLEPSSQISTDFQCDNCRITIDQVSWKQCNQCHSFDLCGQCEQINYDELIPIVLDNHKQYHKKMHLNEMITSQDITSISIVEAEAEANQDLDVRSEAEYQRILKQKRIENDYEMAIVMNMLQQKQNPISTESSDVHSMISGYHIQASQTNIRILSLDGGGIRGYMPIQVLCQLITETHLSDIENFNAENDKHQELFHAAQAEFIKKFDYFTGTSTGGLIGFCLAINYNILKLKKIYERSSFYFKRNRLGPYLWDKYDPVNIHNEIDKIIDQIQWPHGQKLTAKNATLLDLHNLLNPKQEVTIQQLAKDKLDETLMSYGNWLEFYDSKFSKDIGQSKIRSFVEREKVLLITAYNTTGDIMTVFNTSYAKHWPYLIADVLKATMAAPTYFPPQHIHKRIIRDGHFIEDPHPKPAEIFIDGGVFANDPELVAMWAIRMQWKKLVNYHLLSIGTGTYNGKLSPTTRGGYPGWIRTDGLAINILMDATRSSTEIMGNNLAKFNNIRRMKFNYRIIESMSLDDPTFIQKFNDEWESLKTGDDFKALLYFYNKYINKQSK